MRKISTLATVLLASFVMTLSGLAASSVATASVNETVATSFSFSVGSSVLNKSQKVKIKKVVATSGTDATFRVTGAAGKLPGVSDGAAQLLAKKRGQVVKAYLVKLGVKKSNITVKVKITRFGILPRTKLVSSYADASPSPSTSPTAASSYAITWDHNGGTSVTPGPSTYAVAESINSLPLTTTKDGYEFDGWYVDSGFSGSAIDDTYTPGSPYGAITFYAKWTTITPLAPAIETATITGAPAVGEILTAVSTGVTGAPTPTESYQWQRFDSISNDFVDINKETSSTYTVLTGDADASIRVVITATNGVAPAVSATSSGTDPISAQAVQCGSGKYLISTTGVAKTWTRCTGPVTISSSVTSIANYGFERSGITNLTIPGTVATIGQGAFSATALTSLTLQEGIQSIGFATFSTGDLYSAAPVLTNVVLPDSLTSLGPKAFFQTRIAYLTIGSGLSSIPSEAFYNNWACGSLNIVFKAGNLTNIEGKSFIGTCASTVTIPSGVTNIGREAFAASTISTIYLPTSIDTLYSDATPSNGIFGSGNSLQVVNYCGTDVDVLNYSYPRGVIPTC